MVGNFLGVSTIKRTSWVLAAISLLPVSVLATVFGDVRGIVHDPDHRPVERVNITLRALSSEYQRTGITNSDGSFEFSAVPIGEYRVTVTHEGFAPVEQSFVVVSGTAPVLHFQFRLAQAKESIQVSENVEAVNPDSFTPTTLVSRVDIDRTPGADQTNSLRMITSFVPGAYLTHDL